MEEKEQVITFLKDERARAIQERDVAVANERTMARVIGILEGAVGILTGLVIAAQYEAGNEQYLAGETFEEVLESVETAKTESNALLKGILPEAD